MLPSEVLGWLLLRRAGLTSQLRLSVQAAAGNSLKLDSVERALRGMEEEFLQHEGQGKGGREPPRRRAYWVEESGHWSLLLGEPSELDDLVEGGDTLYVGTASPQVYYDTPVMWHASDGWQEQDMSPTSWWSTPEIQEGWNEDAEQKMRSFVQARQAVKARNLSRGFYPFSPHSKGGSFKGKKGKGKGKSKTSSSSSTSFLSEGFLGAAHPTLGASFGATRAMTFEAAQRDLLERAQRGRRVARSTLWTQWSSRWRRSLLKASATRTLATCSSLSLKRRWLATRSLTAAPQRLFAACPRWSPW